MSDDARSDDPRPDDHVAELLIVCTGNVARSPLCAAMLEHEARARLGAQAPVWVRSAGVHALVGEPAVQGSRVEAERRGLELARHRGELVDPAVITSADLVITMSEAHRRHLVNLVPRAAAKIFTLRELARLAEAMKPLDEVAARQELGELTPRARVRLFATVANGARPYVPRSGTSEDVADPIGRPQEAFARMATEVEQLVGVLAPQLFGPADGPRR